MRRSLRLSIGDRLSAETRPLESEAADGISLPEEKPCNQAEDIVQSKAASGRGTRRFGTKPSISEGEVSELISTPITDDERDHWKGWSEVESEPAFFNVMLREFGINGIKVQEIFSLDEDMISSIPKPVHGLIFLSQFAADDPNDQEETCPDHVWFANQTTNNACATIAILNIVMNIPGLELGPTIWSLKDFTQHMPPILRGYTVGNHEYIRKVHNSFIRRTDLLNADLALSQDYDESEKKRMRKVGSKKKAQADDDSAFHFTAFLPIDGYVWKLDGMDHQPTNLGHYDDDWMEVVRPLIQMRMMRQETDVLNYTLLSLCRAPLLSIPGDIANSIRNLLAIEARLDENNREWRSFLGDEDSSLFRGPDKSLKVTQDLIEEATASQMVTEQLKDLELDVTTLLDMRNQVVESQLMLRRSMLEEISAVEDDNKAAELRRHDYTPMIHTWLRILAEKGILKGICEDLAKS